MIGNDAIILFQSHNGAIAARIETKSWTAGSAFQSHNGAIAAITKNIQTLNFCAFQSHNGAIAARSSGKNQRRFVIVSIPQWCDCCLSQIVGQFVRQVCFNPTMVRLLLDYEPDAIIIDHMFQSHNGAIAANVTDSLCGHISLVSIPQWCDCCLLER